MEVGGPVGHRRWRPTGALPSRDALPDLFRYAMRLTGGDQALAEDLVQEACLALVRELRHEPAAQLDVGWLMVVLRRRYLDQVRSGRRERSRLERRGTHARSALAEPDWAAVDDRVGCQALGKLNADQRVALVLRYVDDLAVRDVAAKLRRSVAADRVAYSPVAAISWPLYWEETVMDDFVAMLERATESPPPAVVNRVLDAVTIEVAVRGSQPACPAAVGNTVTVVSRLPWDRRRRWKVATAALLAVAATVTVLTMWRRPDGAPAVSTTIRGDYRHESTWAPPAGPLTWLPPDYQPTHATDNGIRLTSPDQPAIDITVRRGEIPIVAPLLQLAPLAEAHHDDAAGVLQWNQAGWSFTLDAAAVIPSALLLRLAVAIVPDSDLTPPTADQTSTVQLPDVVGLDYREATARLSDAGFSVRWAISSTASSAVGTWNVSTPVAGSTVKAGSAVTLGVVGVASGMPPWGDALVSGDLPDAVGYYQRWLRDPASAQPDDG